MFLRTDTGAQPREWYARVVIGIRGYSLLLATLREATSKEIHQMQTYSIQQLLAWLQAIHIANTVSPWLLGNEGSHL